MALNLATQMCPPMLRWQRHTRIRCHIFASGSSPDKTASNRKLRLTTPKECGCDTELTILQITLPSAASPPKRKSAVSMRSNEAAEHFFVARNQLHKKKEGMWATLQEDESGRRPAQALHVFCQRRTCSARVFDRPRMKLVQQVPHRLPVHTTSACCWELKSLRLSPSVWTERGVLLFAPIPQGQGLRP